ncbi:MAG: hypothetical protein ACLP5E_16650 [Streptosporangiaceae bacterium]
MSDLGIREIACAALVVLVDHAAEDLSPLNWQVQRSSGLAALIGRSLLAGLVGPVPVVMADVLVEDRSKVPFVVDQHLVGAFGSYGEAEVADLVTEVHQQVAGLLGSPRAVRVGGCAEDVHVLGRHMTNSTYRCFRR